MDGRDAVPATVRIRLHPSRRATPSSELLTMESPLCVPCCITSTSPGPATQQVLSKFVPSEYMNNSLTTHGLTFKKNGRLEVEAAS